MKMVLVSITQKMTHWSNSWKKKKVLNIVIVLKIRLDFGLKSLKLTINL